MGRCAEEIPVPATGAAPLGRDGALVRRSRAARWRAWVLIAVHVVVALHIGHWLASGSTLTPVEPSEAMELSKKGIVNAGAVLFGLCILSTLFLGRWFCGWACHVVALQDLCRAALIKIGVRPKPVQLGLLAVVPWLAFVYMFLAPLVQRALFGQSLAVTGTHFRTEQFWATFPPLWMALATFAVCGFAIVYLLGAKGFCTYACPYGGIFGIVDQLAPLRIRVTDACEGCGHCTVSCSSNVRVHQEVREHGMVVDPGCMKCLDCVSVCPKDALYVGFGVPALLARPRPGSSGGARKPRDARAGRDAFLRTLVLSAFTVATLAVLMQHDAPLDARLTWILGAACLAVAVAFRGRSRRPTTPAWHEEALLGAAFLASLWSLRGFHGVPLLFALGLSSILAWAVQQAVRALTGRSGAVQRHALVAAGRPTKPGVAFAALLVPVCALWGHAGWTRFSAERDARAAQQAYETGIAHALADDLEAAIASFRSVVELRPDHWQARENLAGMLCATGRFEEGVREFELALEQNPGDAGTHRLLARALFELGRGDEAREHEREAERLERR